MSAPKKILIVDDEFDLLEAVKFALNGERYATVTTHDPRDALRLASVEHPSLIITDLTMPGMNGYELIMQVKETDGLKEIPIILTSLSTPTARQKDIGWNHFLKKPFDFETLLGAVRDLIGSAEATPATSAESKASNDR